MRSITIDVPEVLANRLESASERERLVWLYQLAGVIEGDSGRKSLPEIRAEIEAWHAAHGVAPEEFDKLFAELCEED
jgi:hypothetical protein